MWTGPREGPRPRDPGPGVCHFNGRQKAAALELMTGNYLEFSTDRLRAPLTGLKRQ